MTNEEAIVKLSRLKELFNEMEPENHLPPQGWIELDDLVSELAPGFRKCADFWRKVP